MSTRVPTDSYDQLVWTLDESAAPWVSTGASPSVTLDKPNPYAPDVTIVPGIFGNAVIFNGEAGSLRFISQALGPAYTDGEIAANVTLSAWVYLRGFSLPAPHSAYSAIAAKAADRSGWFNPYASVGLYVDSTGNLVGLMAVSGTLVSWTGTSGLTLNTWNHVGFTFDGSTVKLYVNGALVKTATQAGVIDYGTHGPWMIGGDTSIEQNLYGAVDDVRWASTVRDASWFSTVYAQGTGGGGGGVVVTPSLAFNAGLAIP